MPPKPFLTAEWRHLAMLNFEADPEILRPHVPKRTELDLWQGRCLVSLVGFLFLRTRVRGVPIPFHRDFEEVNLRFYVRREAEDGWRRGVVFIKELVPRWAIAFVARAWYGENYQAVKMNHLIEPWEDGSHDGHRVRYGWTSGGQENQIAIHTEGEFAPLDPDSEEAFITEHYWGYCRQRSGGTVEYQVEHPPWKVCRAGVEALEVDTARLYGTAFVPVLNAAPSSVFLAEGSAIAVYPGQRLAN